MIKNNENAEYRKNVGLVVIKNGLFFAGFRADVPQFATTGWQLPQGGVDTGEDILTAGYRELYEETGIKKEKVKLIKILPQTLLSLNYMIFRAKNIKIKRSQIASTS